MRAEVRKLTTPVQNLIMHLLAQRLHAGIGKASVQRAHAVGVVARAVDGSKCSDSLFMRFCQRR
jgi:hypothetical protein